MRPPFRHGPYHKGQGYENKENGSLSRKKEIERRKARQRTGGIALEEAGTTGVNSQRGKKTEGKVWRSRREALPLSPNNDESGVPEDIRPRG